MGREEQEVSRSVVVDRLAAAVEEDHQELVVLAVQVADLSGAREAEPLLLKEEEVDHRGQAAVAAILVHLMEA